MADEASTQQAGEEAAVKRGQKKGLRMLAPDTRDAMLSIAEKVSFKAGDLIFAEGDQTNDFYLIEEGHVIGFRAGHGDEVEWQVARLGPGDVLGEVSFLDGGPRQISVRADTDGTLLKVHPFDLLALENGDHFYDNLRASIGITVVERMRVSTEKQIAALKRQLEDAKTQQQFGHFLLFTISIFLISTMLFYLVAEDYVQDVYDPGFSWQTVFFLAVPCLLIIKLMKIPLADLGIKREGFWRALVESIIICIVITIPAAVYMFGFRETPAGGSTGVTVDGLFLVQYLAHSLFQEVGSRGLLQGLFQKFLNDTKGHRAIFMTSVVFASLHITFGIDAVVITFFASIVFGYVYLRQKNLIGVTVLHYWLGVLAALLVAI